MQVGVIQSFDPKSNPKYWVGQKVHLGFSIRCYQPNPIDQTVRGRMNVISAWAGHPFLGLGLGLEWHRWLPWTSSLQRADRGTSQPSYHMSQSLITSLFLYNVHILLDLLPWRTLTNTARYCAKHCTCISLDLYNLYLTDEGTEAQSASGTHPSSHGQWVAE